MYPEGALGEFYPPWLIEEADQFCDCLEAIHAYCSPRMKIIGYSDRGQAYLHERVSPGVFLHPYYCPRAAPCDEKMEVKLIERGES